MSIIKFDSECNVSIFIHAKFTKNKMFVLLERIVYNNPKKLIPRRAREGIIAKQPVILCNSKLVFCSYDAL